MEPQGSMYGLFHHKQASDLEALKYGLDHGIGVAPGNMVRSRITYELRVRAGREVSSVLISLFTVLGRR